jgi:hypothetical protein
VFLLKKVGYGGFASRNTPRQADNQHQVSRWMVPGRDFTATPR